MSDLNWGGAFETLGKGLGELAKVRINKEENEIQHLRQKALQELGIQANKELQASNQAFQQGMEQTRHSNNMEAGAVDIAARRGDQLFDRETRTQLQSREEGFRSRLESQRQGFELKVNKLKSVEDVRQRTEYQMSQIDRDIKDYRKLLTSSDTDPAKVPEIESYITSLEQQREVVFASGAAAEARIMEERPIPYPGKQPPPEATPTGKDGQPTPVTSPRGGPGPSKDGVPEGAYTGKAKVSGLANDPFATTLPDLPYQGPDEQLFGPRRQSATQPVNLLGNPGDLFDPAARRAFGG